MHISPSFLKDVCSQPAANITSTLPKPAQCYLSLRRQQDGQVCLHQSHMPHCCGWDSGVSSVGIEGSAVPTWHLLCLFLTCMATSAATLPLAVVFLAQAALRLVVIHLPYSSKCWGLRTCHHTLLKSHTKFFPDPHREAWDLGWGW